MAHLESPLFSIEAHGTIANILTYSKRKNQSQTRSQKKQKDILSTLRNTQRGFFRDGFEAWLSLTAEQRETWSNFNSSQ